MDMLFKRGMKVNWIDELVMQCRKNLTGIPEFGEEDTALLPLEKSNCYMKK